MLYDSFKIGPLTIKYIYIGYLIGFVFAYILMKYRIKQLNHESIRSKLFEIYSNLIFIGIISWKLSYIFINPQNVVQAPLSLLYFNGETIGLLLSVVLCVVYLMYAGKKYGISYRLIFDITIVGVLAFLTGSYLFQAIFSLSNHLFLFSLGFAFILLLQVSIQKPLYFKSIFQEGVTKMKKIIGILILVGLIGFALLNVLTDEPKNQNTGISIGDVAPDFTLQSVYGEKVNLSDFRGKPVILNFWATWCPPCKAEIPEMVEFYEENRNDVEIVAVNLTNTETGVNVVENFVNEYYMEFPVLLNEKKVDQTYQILTIPTTYFLDSEGIIREKITGPMNMKMMESITSKLK